MADTQPTTILIADDHQMFGQAVAAALKGEGGFDVVGIAPTLADARAMLNDNGVDVLLLDQRLPDGRGTQAVRSFREAHPALRILMLSAAADDAVLAEALSAGCAGYVHKSASVEHLVAAIRAAQAGATSISPDLLERFMRGPQEPGGSALTPRELTILGMLADGLSSAEICEQASISPNTLRNHTQNILSKLGAHSKLEAVTQAIRDGLVAAPERD